MSEVMKATKQRLIKLNNLLTSLKKGERFEITRLTMVKKMCNDLDDARAFAFHMASWAKEKYKPKSNDEYFALMERAMKQLKKTLRSPSDTHLTKLRSIHSKLKERQSETRNIPFGVARIIESRELLTVEEAIECCLTSNLETARYWAYQITRNCCDVYDGKGEGLNKGSIQAVDAVVGFWNNHYGHNLNAANN
ncbi:MAG: hypothetical protein AB8G05_27405 [Oligoflexales bacterium]